MKRLFVFLTVLSVIFGAAIYYKYLNLNSQPLQKITASPLPELLNKTFPAVLGVTNQYWQPVNYIIENNKLKSPVLTAGSALSYDLTSDRFLYEKNIKKRLPIASLTKIMTALVALENYDINHEFSVTKNAANIGEDSMGLSQGEKLSLEDLLYGLILNSGNDSAETIAQGSNFGRSNFVYLMNQEAEQLGLSDTRFTNPTGLQGDGDQYSTVYDLLIMTRYALQNSDFAQAASTYEHDIPKTSQHKAYTLYNETNLLTSYPGVRGVKTGFTDEAGLCLVTYLNYDGHRIISILLNAENRRQEMKNLLDYSLKSLGVKPPAHE